MSDISKSKEQWQEAYVRLLKLIIYVLVAGAVLAGLFDIFTESTAETDWVLIVLIASIGLGAFFYQVGVHLWSVAIKCPYSDCNSKNTYDSEWTCGYCEHTNNPIKHFRNSSLHFFSRSLLGGRCTEEGCKKVPKSVLCRVCEAIFYLDNDRDGENPAKIIPDTLIPPEKGGYGGLAVILFLGIGLVYILGQTVPEWATTPILSILFLIYLFYPEKDPNK